MGGKGRVLLSGEFLKGNPAPRENRGHREPAKPPVLDKKPRHASAGDGFIRFRTHGDLVETTSLETHERAKMTGKTCDFCQMEEPSVAGNESEIRLWKL